jgi:hypothetical protein
MIGQRYPLPRGEPGEPLRMLAFFVYGGEKTVPHTKYVWADTSPEGGYPVVSRDDPSGCSFFSL